MVNDWEGNQGFSDIRHAKLFKAKIISFSCFCFSDKTYLRSVTNSHPAIHDTLNQLSPRVQASPVGLVVTKPPIKHFKTGFGKTYQKFLQGN